MQLFATALTCDAMVDARLDPDISAAVIRLLREVCCSLECVFFVVRFVDREQKQNKTKQNTHETTTEIHSQRVGDEWHSHAFGICLYRFGFHFIDRLFVISYLRSIYYSRSLTGERICRRFRGKRSSIWCASQRQCLVRFTHIVDFSFSCDLLSTCHRLSV
jgi:hypothetical protein